MKTFTEQELKKLIEQAREKEVKYELAQET